MIYFCANRKTDPSIFHRHKSSQIKNMYFLNVKTDMLIDAKWQNPSAPECNEMHIYHSRNWGFDILTRSFPSIDDFLS